MLFCCSARREHAHVCDWTRLPMGPPVLGRGPSCCQLPRYVHRFVGDPAFAKTLRMLANSIDDRSVRHSPWHKRPLHWLTSPPLVWARRGTAPGYGRGPRASTASGLTWDTPSATDAPSAAGRTNMVEAQSWSWDAPVATGQESSWRPWSWYAPSATGQDESWDDRYQQSNSWNHGSSDEGQ